MFGCDDIYLFVCFVSLSVKLMVEGEDEDEAGADLLCSASAIFLALYDQPAGAAETALPPDDNGVGGDGVVGGGVSEGGSCRLGDLLRKV